MIKKIHKKKTSKNVLGHMVGWRVGLVYHYLLAVSPGKSSFTISESGAKVVQVL